MRRVGARQLTGLERASLANLQAKLQEAAGQAWLGPAHVLARERLEFRLAMLYRDGVPVSALATALGVAKSRAGRLVQAGRARQ